MSVALVSAGGIILTKLPRIFSLSDNLTKWKNRVLAESSNFILSFGSSARF